MSFVSHKNCHVIQIFMYFQHEIVPLFFLQKEVQNEIRDCIKGNKTISRYIIDYLFV